ncbi:hypothetical protein P2W68_10650 [Chryseobacterium arthrosphaerae]|uniref:HYC_CC_PP family protein n=1 Tax=Chryseobacterium arthrosphaerae TaxID=651561 RepID=UPI0023E1886B|nr:hypothetical protein [Chryseobacterium arthrosphaerae]WET00072.1 hypothetical protein P2W68_10650 [Chryseobacterium arthrosphaerae]
MKRVLHILFLLLYIVVSSGFTTSRHVCKENSSEIHVGLKKLSDLDCPKCKANKQKDHNGCCKLEVKKICKEDNLPHSYKTSPVKFLSASIPYYTLGTVFDNSSAFAAEKHAFYFDPSKYHLNYPSLFILHCVYRI